MSACNATIGGQASPQNRPPAASSGLDTVQFLSPGGDMPSFLLTLVHLALAQVCSYHVEGVFYNEQSLVIDVEHPVFKSF